MQAETEQSIYKKKVFAGLSSILQAYGYKTISECSGYSFPDNFFMPQGVADACDLVAFNSDGRIIFFICYAENRESFFKKLASEICAADQESFRLLHYMIFASSEDMDKCRRLEWAENWPRGFFISSEELEKKAGRLHKDTPDFRPEENNNQKHKAGLNHGIRHFTAEVISNSPVGAGKHPGHYLLKFKAEGLRRIVPGQFVMLDTLQADARDSADYYNNPGLRSGASAKKFFQPRSFLKRPFGIHRCYYKNFNLNYLKHLSLPADLAEISHTVFPHKFEILYKLVPGGTGTNELKKINKGERIKMLGPLGKPEDPVSWRLNGIEEIHLVGGGVGMAPLVFFGQTLKFYTYNIKAFLGIDQIGTLMRTAPLEKGYAVKTEDSFVYIDELTKIGLNPDEIFLSSEERSDQHAVSHKISASNLHHGFITEQYKAYLGRLKSHKKIMIIACGPTPMLKALKKIVDEFQVPMKVLLEKRMACGIGVCMACVCRTISDDKEEYSRVCMDGPMFDSEKICWEKL